MPSAGRRASSTRCARRKASSGSPARIATPSIGATTRSPKRADDDIDAFFLTDFLARQFESFVIEPLGLDRHPELRDMYFGNYRRLIFLAQTEDAELETKARGAAERLGLAFEKRVTGHGRPRRLPDGSLTRRRNSLARVS